MPTFDPSEVDSEAPPSDTSSSAAPPSPKVLTFDVSQIDGAAPPPRQAPQRPPATRGQVQTFDVSQVDAAPAPASAGFTPPPPPGPPHIPVEPVWTPQRAMGTFAAQQILGPQAFLHQTGQNVARIAGAGGRILAEGGGLGGAPIPPPKAQQADVQQQLGQASDVLRGVPLLPLSTLMPQAGLARGVAKGVEGLTSPFNLALAAAIPGLHEAVAEAPGMAAAVTRDLASLGLNAYFQVGLWQGAGQAGKQAWNDYKNGDAQKALEDLGEAGVNAVMAGLQTKHAADSITGLANAYGIKLGDFRPRQPISRQVAPPPPAPPQPEAATPPETPPAAPPSPETPAPNPAPSQPQPPVAAPANAPQNIAKGASFTLPDGVYTVMGTSGNRVVYRKVSGEKKSTGTMPLDSFEQLISQVPPAAVSQQPIPPGADTSVPTAAESPSTTEEPLSSEQSALPAGETTTGTAVPQPPVAAPAGPEPPTIAAAAPGEANVPEGQQNAIPPDRSTQEIAGTSNVNPGNQNPQESSLQGGGGTGGAKPTVPQGNEPGVVPGRAGEGQGGPTGNQPQSAAGGEGKVPNAVNVPLDQVVAESQRQEQFQLPREGQSPEDALAHAHDNTLTIEQRGKEGGGYVLADVPTNWLGTDSTHVDAERQNRLEQIGGTQDPIFITEAPLFQDGRKVLEPINGNNRVQYAEDHGLPAVKAYVVKDVWDQFAEEKANQKHEFASTQVNMPPEVSKAVASFGRTIPDDRLAEDGRQDVGDIHATALYGLHAEDPDQVRELLKDQGPITVTLGKASVFPASEAAVSRGGAGAADVLKVDVDSPDLHALNAKLKQLPHTNNFPVYQPHVTIAYLKPGEGQKYDGAAIPGVTGKQITLNSLTFSGKDGKQVEIPLTGKSLSVEQSASPAREATTGTEVPQGGGGEPEAAPGTPDVGTLPKEAARAARLGAARQAADDMERDIVEREKTPIARSTPAPGTLQRAKLNADYAAADKERDALWAQERKLKDEIGNAKPYTKRRESLENRLEKLNEQERAKSEGWNKVHKDHYVARLEDAANQTENKIMQIAARYQLRESAAEMSRKAGLGSPDYDALRRSRSVAANRIVDRLNALVPELDKAEAGKPGSQDAKLIAAVTPEENAEAIKTAVGAVAGEFIDHPLLAGDGIEKRLGGAMWGRRMDYAQSNARKQLDALEEEYKQVMGIAAMSGHGPFRDDSNKIEGRWGLDEMNGAVAHAREIVAAAREQKAGEEVVAKKSAEEFNRSMRPLAEVKAPTIREKGVWNGNVISGEGIVSDGHSLIDASAVTDKKRLAALSAKGEQTRGLPAAAAREKTWNPAIRAAKNPLAEIGHNTHKFLDTAFYSDASGKVYAFGTKKVRFIQSVTGADSLRGSTPERVAVFYKGDKPVAALMPVRYDGPAIDPEAARQAAAGAKPLTTSETEASEEPTRFSRESPGFYSQLQRTLEAKMPEKASREQVAAIINNPQSGVKPDEIKWTGLGEWLAQQKGPVTKQQVMDYLRANHVEIQEVVLGEEGIPPEAIAKAERMVEKAAERWDGLDWGEEDDETGYPFESHENYNDTDDLALKIFRWDMRQEWPDRYVEAAERIQKQLQKVADDAEEAADHGARAVDLLRNGNEGAALDAIRASAQIERSYGDDPHWGRVKSLLENADSPTAPEFIARFVAAIEKASDEWQGQSWPEEDEDTGYRFDERDLAIPGDDLAGKIFDDTGGQLPRKYYKAAERIDTRIQEVEADAESARDSGRSAVAALKAGDPEEAVEAISQASRIERSYGDDPVWGPVEDYFKHLGAHGPKYPREWVLPGGENPREFVFIAPQADPWGADDEAHYGDVGEGKQIGWARVNDRRGPRGERILHVEEIQTKRGQAGRKQGFQPGGEIPDAPLLKNFEEFAFRRLLRYAAEHGYDGLTWTTGQQQAERYHLAKFVSRVEYDPEQQLLSVYDKSGVRLSSIPSRVPASELPDYIGKPATEDLLKAPMRKRAGEEISGKPAVHVLHPENMKLGGESHQTLYDEKLPRFADKLGKKWGAKVGTTQIRTGSSEDETGVPDPFAASTKETVHYLPITPAMRESVMQGQPLFALGIPSDIAGIADHPSEPQAIYRNGILFVNRRTMDLLAERTKVRGMYLPPKGAASLLSEIEGKMTPAAKTWWKAHGARLRNTFNEAGAGGKGVVVVRYDKGQSLADVKETIRHELFHQSERWGGDTAGKILLKDPLAQKAADALIRRGYDRDDVALLWSEIGAHLAGGPGNWKQIGLTREEAKQLFRRYTELMPTQTVLNLRRIAPQLNEELYAARTAARGFAELGREGSQEPARPEEGAAGRELRRGVRPDLSTGPARYSLEPEVGQRGPTGETTDASGAPQGGEGTVAPSSRTSNIEQAKPEVNHARDFLKDESGSSNVIPRLSQFAQMLKDRFGEEDAPKANYSGLGAVQDKWIRNLSQTAKVSPEVHAAQLRAATPKSQAGVLIATAHPMMRAILKKSGLTLEDFYGWLIHDRLQNGLKPRWESFGQMAQTMPEEELEQAMTDAAFLGLLKKTEGKKDLADDLAETALSIAQAKDWPLLRDFLDTSFHDAAEAVTSMMPEEKWESLNNDPNVQQALNIYKQRIEKPVAADHAINEGIFSTALGKTDTYVPLVPVLKDIKGGYGRNFPYRKPKNIANKFATGLAEGYETEVGKLRERYVAGIRSNTKAALIRAAEEAGLMQDVSRGGAPDRVVFEGTEYKASRPYAISDARTIIANGKVIHVPAKLVVMPEWFHKEMAPILEGEQWDLDGANLLVKALMKLTLSGPAEAAFHWANITGAIVSNTPFLQDSLAGKVMSLPGIKRLASIGYVLAEDPTTDEAARSLMEMAQVGAVPSRFATETYSKRYAEELGAKRRLLSLAPALFGPEGFDIRARLLMWRLAKELNPGATPTDLNLFVNQLGNYVPQLQGRVERLLKSTGLSPFYTAGSTMMRNGLNAWTAMSPAPVQKAGKWTLTPPKLGPNGRKIYTDRTASLIGWKLLTGALGTLALWIALHKLINGKYPWQDRRSKFLQIPVGNENPMRRSGIGRAMWGNGPETGYLGVNFLNPLVARGARAFGLQGAYNAKMRHGSAGQEFEAAQRDVLDSLAHPVMGPPLRSAFILGMGVEPQLADFRDRRGNWQPQFFNAIPRNAKPGLQTAEDKLAAQLSLNSFYNNLGEATGLLANPAQKGNIWARAFVDMAAPGLFGQSSNPYKQETILREQRKSLHAGQ